MEEGMDPRFELQEVKERDGVVYITVTILHKIPGSEILVGANWKYTETVSSHTWRYKDGQIQAQTDRLEWAEPVEHGPEFGFVLAALGAHGYVETE
jgi:hypothetical protein